MNGQGEPKKDGLMEKEFMASPLLIISKPSSMCQLAYKCLLVSYSTQPLWEAEEEPNFHSKKKK